MNIFRLEVRNMRKSTLISTVSFCGIIFAMLMFFPSMANESMKMLADTKLKGMPPAVLEALGLSTIPDFTVITNYFGYVLQFIALAIMVMAMQRAATLLIKEETNGTIEYLGAKPVSRRDIFVQKGLAHLAYLVFVQGSCLLVTALGYMMFTDYTLTASIREAAIFFGAVLFAALIYSAVGMMLSTMLKSSKEVAGVAMGVVFGTYILGIMSLIVQKLDFLVWISPMEWIKAQKLMSEGLLLQEWILGIGLMGAAILAAWLKYRRKDWLI